jgi:hypothetical protein
MPAKKTVARDKPFPAVPYEANRHQQLVCYWFAAGELTEEAIDALVGEFLQRCMRNRPRLTRPLEMWRGNTKALAGALRGIGVSSGAPRWVYDALLDVVGDASCDYGMRTPIQTEFEPSVVLAAGDVWKFDAAAPPRSTGHARLGSKKFDVRFLPYVWKKRTKRRGSTHTTYEEIVEALQSWRGQLSTSLLDNWSFFREHWTELVDAAGAASFDAAVLQRVCERAIGLKFAELPIPEHGRIVCQPILNRTDGGWVEAGFDIRVLLRKGLQPRQKVAALAHELGHFIHHLPHYVFFSRLPLLVMNDPALESAVAHEWQPLGETYYVTTEMRADLTACAFLVAEGVAEYVSSNAITVFDNHPAHLESMWTRRAIESDSGDVSEAYYCALLEAAARDTASGGA